MPTTHTILQGAAEMINEEIRKIFREQGHHLTGAWEDSLSSTSFSENEIEGRAKSYGAIVNEGVPASRIPFGGEGSFSGVGIGGGTGEGESFHPVSQYIQGLFRFWKLRKPGITDKEALSLAFATAHVQKKEGMSTVNSQRYSQWGDRQHFVGIAFAQKDEELTDYVYGGLVQVVNEMIEEPLNATY